ncbi:MAG: GatB/YqeY domain-containing protein [Deferrisomatales bacterium]|nr:GatB/YqeY domain-containing protein [Deferrisomatales bacterium]
MSGNSPLLSRIDRELVASMKARTAARTSALRMARSALQYREIDKRAPLEDADVLQVLGTLVKQRREAAEQFRAGNRPELAEKEEAELAVLREFLPAALSEQELRNLVAEVVRQVGAQGLSDLGKVMGVLMPAVRGRADGRAVNDAVRAALGAGR